MRAYKYVFLALVVVLSSCSSTGDDTPVVDRSGTLTGTWRAIAYTIEGSTLTLINSDEASLVTFEGVGFEFTTTLFIGENPQNFSRQGEFKLDFFVTDDNGHTTFTQGLVPVSENGTWSFANNQITFTENGEQRIGIVRELTNTQLKYQISSNEDFVDGSTSTSTNRVEVFTFERIN